MKYPKFLSVDLMEVSEGMVRDGIEFGRVGIRMRRWKLGIRQGEKITRFSLSDSGREDVRGERSSTTRRER